MATGFNMSFNILFKFRRKGGVEKRSLCNLVPLHLGGKLNLQASSHFLKIQDKHVGAQEFRAPRASKKDTCPKGNFKYSNNLRKLQILENNFSSLISSPIHLTKICQALWATGPQCTSELEALRCQYCITSKDKGLQA